jgi:carbonic anhydrase
MDLGYFSIVVVFSGPDEWPGMCQAGARQSPVGLDPENAVPAKFGPLVLLNYDKKAAANVTNNGHTGKSKLVTLSYVLHL